MGVDTRILKIRCFLAEKEAKQNHAGDVFAASPFIGLHLEFIYQFWYTQLGYLIKVYVILNVLYLFVLAKNCSKNS